MKIVNYRPIQNSQYKVIALFDIEEVEMAFDGKIYNDGAYRNWEVRQKRDGNGFYVSPRYAYQEEINGKKLNRMTVEPPPAIRKMFFDSIISLLIELRPELSSNPTQSSSPF
jgi:hypothetical protein